MGEHLATSGPHADKELKTEKKPLLGKNQNSANYLEQSPSNAGPAPAAEGSQASAGPRPTSPGERQSDVEAADTHTQVALKTVHFRMKNSFSPAYVPRCTGHTFFLNFLIAISLSGARFRIALIVPFQLNLPAIQRTACKACVFVVLPATRRVEK